MPRAFGRERMSYYEYHTARRYVQYDGAFDELARYIAYSGRRPLILMGAGPMNDELQRRIADGAAKPFRPSMRTELIQESGRYASNIAAAERLDAEGDTVHPEFMDINDLFATEKNARMIAGKLAAGGFDTVVGVGGGRALDLARAATCFFNVSVILAPTLAATNASISTLSVIYGDDGRRIEAYWRMENAPDLVIVDTGVILRNPLAVLAAGIGDIMSTYMEAISNVTKAGTREKFSALGYEGVKLAIRVMMEAAPGAMDAVRRSVITPDFETVVSMIMNNCGPLWSICSMGLAHLIDEIMLCFEESHLTPHGKRVGWATKVMLVEMDAPEEAIERYLDFCRAVGIPTMLEELGLDKYDRDAWLDAAMHSVVESGRINSLEYPITVERIVDVILESEKLAL